MGSVYMGSYVHSAESISRVKTGLIRTEQKRSCRLAKRPLDANMSCLPSGLTKAKGGKKPPDCA